MFVGVAVAITLMMVFSSFGIVAASGTRQDDELILRVAMQDDLKTLNPLTAGDVWTWNVVGYLYDGPINVNPDTDKLIPYIAVGSANQSDDLSTVEWSDCTVGTFGFDPQDEWTDPGVRAEATIFYDFTGVTWHDNQQMTIKDVLFSYHVQAQMPDWTSSVNCLKDKGGRAGTNYPNDHKLYIDLVYGDMDSTQAALKFTLQEPFADFFRNTLSAFLLPYHIWGTQIGGQSTLTKIWIDPGYTPDAADAWDADAATAWDNPEPIGSGPFKFERWDSAGGISKISTYRDHFYNEDWAAAHPEYDPDGVAKQPNIDAILFKIYKTAEAAVLALKADDVDFIAWSVPPTFVGDLANEPGVTLQQSPEQGFFYLSYNMRKQSYGYDESANFPYAANEDLGKSFRKAVAHCIDKNKIVQRLLLNFGVPGEGPVSSVSSWYNSSIPKYDFRPQEAIDILTNAGYQLTDGAGSTPGPGNWWLRPDGQPIGSGAGGKIEILTPQADYDPIRAQAGLMIAQELQNVGINAESIAMDFGSIVDRIDQRQFDMYILGWRIGSDPTDFLHAFFHSSTAVAGQNYPGYQNQSFDQIIDHARQTGDEDLRKQDVFDAQATIAYDLPYDVLYFRTNIEAYRSDNFVDWTVGSSGSIFNWRSIFNIRQPSKYKLNAQFVNPPSAMKSNATVPISVLVKDQDRVPVQGAQVWLNASGGALGMEIDNTTSSGKISTIFTAPYVPPTPDNIANGTTVILNIKEGRYTDSAGIEYDPAPSRLALITIFPEGVDFLSVSMAAEPDVIDPDYETEADTYGFTYVEVEVKLHTDANPGGDPVAGIDVYVEVTPDVPDIEPASATTDANGKATFTLTSTDLPDDDDSTKEFLVIAQAFHPTDANVKNGTQNLHVFIVDEIPPGGPDNTPFPTFLVVASLFCIGAVSYGVTRRFKK